MFNQMSTQMDIRTVQFAFLGFYPEPPLLREGRIWMGQGKMEDRWVGKG